MHNKKLFSSAGWLYADMFLILALIFLSFSSESLSSYFSRGGISFGTPTATPQKDVGEESPNASSTPTPEIQLTQSVEEDTLEVEDLPKEIIALDIEPAIYYIWPDQDIDVMTSRFLSDYPDRVTGFVLIFGYARNNHEGIALANETMKYLQNTYPDVFLVGTPYEPLSWIPDASGAKGTIRIKIFFLTGLVE